MRPTANTDALFVSLRTRRSAIPEPLSAGAVGAVGTSSPSTLQGGVREDRRTAHALRHTLCTMLVERGVALVLARDDELHDADLELLADPLHRALVLDDGRLAGLLSLTDVTRVLEATTAGTA